SSEFCDFEVNTCDWQLQSGGFQRNNALNKFRDHTTGTLSGHFLQDTATSQKAVMTKQLATLPIFNSTGTIRSQPFCLKFFYYMSTDFLDGGQMEDKDSRLTVSIKGAGYTLSNNISILNTFNDGMLQTWAMY